MLLYRKLEQRVNVFGLYHWLRKMTYNDPRKCLKLYISHDIHSYTLNLPITISPYFV